MLYRSSRTLCLNSEWQAGFRARITAGCCSHLAEDDAKARPSIVPEVRYEGYTRPSLNSRLT